MCLKRAMHTSLMAKQMLSARLVTIINGTHSPAQGALFGCKVSSGESRPAVKPDCLSAARRSGQSARLGSPSEHSSPSMKIEGSVPARSGSRGTLGLLQSSAPEDSGERSVWTGVSDLIQERQGFSSLCLKL